VGAYIFAGGFTVGVRDAGFRVLCHLEDGGFGTETARLNLGVEVHDDPGSWPVGEIGPVDLVYCNPPCSPWSTAGIVRGLSTEDQTDWRSHPQSHCVATAFSLLRSIGPRVWCFESVRQAYTRGGQMLDEMASEAMSIGYSVTDLFVEAKDFGVPQHRKRYFFVAHKVKIGWRPSGQERDPTVAEFLSRADRTDDRVGKMPGSVAAIASRLSRGENARSCWDRLSSEGAGDLGTRPAFIYDRMASDRPSYTLFGSCNKLHPDEDRLLSVNEMSALCGYPRGYRFVGSTGSRYAQVGKGVCPPVARWLAGEVLSALSRGESVTNPTRSAVTVTSSSSHEGVPMGKQKPGPGRAKNAEPVKMAKSGPVSPVPHGTRPPSKPATRRFTAPGKRVGNLDRRFDKTQLKAYSHGYTVHRDYAAHYFRWGFMFKKITYQKTRVLDVGCGQDVPLCRVLNFRQAAVPALWVGVDMNKVTSRPGISWARLHDEFNFIDRHRELVDEYGANSFDVAVNFEMIEHMHPEDGLRLLRNVSDLVKVGGELVLSTPVYNGRKMAANHLHEYGIRELEDLVGKSGRWRVSRRYGTFASWNDIKKVMTRDELSLMEELGRYYDHEVLSCFMAPKYPDASRNNVWILRNLGVDGGKSA
jgi:DNA (cytosine-5)-methyltransferase 1